MSLYPALRRCCPQKLVACYDSAAEAHQTCHCKQLYLLLYYTHWVMQWPSFHVLIVHADVWRFLPMYIGPFRLTYIQAVSISLSCLPICTLYLPETKSKWAFLMSFLSTAAIKISYHSISIYKVIFITYFRKIHPFFFLNCEKYRKAQFWRLSDVYSPSHSLDHSDTNIHRSWAVADSCPAHRLQNSIPF